MTLSCWIAYNIVFCWFNGYRSVFLTYGQFGVIHCCTCSLNVSRVSSPAACLTICPSSEMATQRASSHFTEVIVCFLPLHDFSHVCAPLLLISKRHSRHTMTWMELNPVREIQFCVRGGWVIKEETTSSANTTKETDEASSTLWDSHHP